jgi:serpin B
VTRLAIVGSLLLAACSASAPASPVPTVPPAAQTAPQGPTDQSSPIQSVLPAPAGTPTPTFAPVTPAAPHVAEIVELKSRNARTQPRGSRLQDVPAAARADLELGLRLYELLTKDNDENLFFSPYSLSTATSMLLAGARGETAAEIRDLLGVPGSDDEWHDARNRMERAFADPDGRWLPRGDEVAIPMQLEATNGFFGQSGYDFRDEFLDVLGMSYGAGLQTLDFIHQPDAALAGVNGWIDERTHGRIPMMLERIDPLTRAIIVNAVYFKAGWMNEFDVDDTAREPFHLIDGSVVDVDVMHTFAGLGTAYAKGDGWEAARLPYWGGASMIVLLPRDGRYAQIESGLDAEFVENVVAELDGTYDVVLSLPKWETDSALNKLEPMLQELGMVQAFDPGLADLSGMSGPSAEPLFLGKVAQKANITVDELGTEAAAATVEIVFGVCRCPPPQVEFVVDRPFIYFIRDDITGEVLFIGRYLGPKAD